IAEETSIVQRHQRAILAVHRPHVVLLKGVVAAGKIHQRGPEIVESLLDAADLLSIARHDCDGRVARRDIDVGRHDRFAKVGEAALPAGSRQVRGDAAAARADGMTLDDGYFTPGAWLDRGGDVRQWTCI